MRLDAPVHDGARNPCPSIRAALADAAVYQPVISGADALCPSIRAALADAAACNWHCSLDTDVSIDQSRVGRCGAVRAERKRTETLVSIDQSRVGRCGDEPRKRPAHPSGVHRSEPRWPMRR